MSLLNELDFVNSIDKRIRVTQNKKHTYELPKGTRNVSFFNQPSQNLNSTTSTQYNLYLNENQILSDYLVEQIRFRVDFSFTNATANPVSPFGQGSGFISPRVLPLFNITDSLNCTINGVPIQINCQNMTPLLAFNKDPSTMGRDLPCCSNLDVYCDYQAGNPLYAGEQGSINNPLLDYYSSTYNQQPRMASIEITTLDNTNIPANTADVVRSFIFTITEPIISGVTSFTYEDAGGFLSANNVQITRNFVSNLVQKLINYFPQLNGGNNPILTYNTTVTNESAILYYQVYTPDNSVPLPTRTFYPVIDYSQRTKTAYQGNWAPNFSDSITSQTISLNYVPKAIFVYLAKDDGQLTLTDMQTPHFQITGLNVSFNGVGGQFSGVTTSNEVYNEFCGRQGFIKSFTETGRTQLLQDNGAIRQIGLYGTVIRIDSTSLSGIDWDKYSVGSQINMNFQVKVTATNNSQVATPNVNLFVQVVYDNVLEITAPNGAQLYKSILDIQGVEDVRRNKPLEFTHEPLMASGLFGKIKEGLKKLYSKGKAVHKFLGENKEALGKAVGLAKGAVSAYQGGAKMKKRHSKKHSKRGSALLAGALVKHRRRHHRYRGGAVDESESEYSDYSECSDPECSCNEYSDSEYEDEMVGGSLIGKSQIQQRLKSIKN